MTPLQFAQQECANHQPNGTCLGVVIADDLSLHLPTADFSPPTSGSPPPSSDSGFSFPVSGFRKCLISSGQRCPYFEECVAPLADMVTDPRRAAALQKAVAEYRKITNQGGLTRTCPECGNPMQPRKRYCPVCADRRRKEATRLHTAKWRLACEQLSQNIPSFS